MRMRIVASTVLLVSIGIVASVASGTARQDLPGTLVSVASPGATETIVLVEIEDYEFVPSRVEITVGDTVRWKNLDTSPHSVISDEEDQSVDSGRMDRGAGFRYTFESPGTFNYECGYHQNMGGVVIVRSAVEDATPVATPAG